jgi:transposase
VNPNRTSSFIKSLGVRNKTDRLEARALGFYGMERHPAPYERLSPEQAELRALSRFRDILMRQDVTAQNREDTSSECKTIRRLAQRQDRQRTRDIKAVEERMKEVINGTPELKRAYELFVSIPGVGFVTACVVLAELGDLRRFERARQLSAFAGLSPRNYRSGTSVRAQARMCKSGNKRVRQALYLAAMVAMRQSGHLQDTYKALLKYDKRPMQALGAIMRKLLVLMRAILISGKPYDPHHRRCGKLCDRTAARCA